MRICTCSMHCSNRCEPACCPFGTPWCSCSCHAMGYRAKVADIQTPERIREALRATLAEMVTR